MNDFLKLVEGFYSLNINNTTFSRMQMDRENIIRSSTLNLYLTTSLYIL